MTVDSWLVLLAATASLLGQSQDGASHAADLAAKPQLTARDRVSERGRSWLGDGWQLVGYTTEKLMELRMVASGPSLSVL